MTDLHRKGDAYAIDHAAVDGMDVLAVEAAVRQAAEQVRFTTQPFFLEARTYRFRAHSMYDAELYRSKAEVERWRRRDPIDLFVARLREQGLLDAAGLARLTAEAELVVDEAVAAAAAAPLEPVADLCRDVLAATAEESVTCPE
jgi:TPP-dependent pyruvate/acetoin dehydrogenase alpha subunit